MFECGKGVYYSSEIIEYVRETFNCVVKVKPIADLVYEYYADLDALMENSLVFGNRVIGLEGKLYSIRLPKIPSVCKTGFFNYRTDLIETEYSLILDFLVKTGQRSTPENTTFLNLYESVISYTRTSANLILSNLTVLASGCEVIHELKFYSKIDMSRTPSILDELKEFNYLPVIEKLDL